jgi:hypothetical protein
MPEYREWDVMHWIDNDLFTAIGYGGPDDQGNDRNRPDLLTCNTSGATCMVVGLASGRSIIYPDGNERL